MEEERNGLNLMYSDKMLMRGRVPDMMDVDGMAMADDYGNLMQENDTSDLQVNTKDVEIPENNQWSRCVKKNLKKFVTEYEDMMQCNVQYEKECHQVPKQVCSNLKVNPKQIEKAYIQTICYNDDEGDGVNINNQAGKYYYIIFIHTL